MTTTSSNFKPPSFFNLKMLLSLSSFTRWAKQARNFPQSVIGTGFRPSSDRSQLLSMVGVCSA